MDSRTRRYTFVRAREGGKKKLCSRETDGRLARVNSSVSPWNSLSREWERRSRVSSCCPCVASSIIYEFSRGNRAGRPKKGRPETAPRDGQTRARRKGGGGERSRTDIEEWAANGELEHEMWKDRRRSLFCSYPLTFFADNKWHARILHVNVNAPGRVLSW